MYMGNSLERFGRSEAEFAFPDIESPASLRNTVHWGHICRDVLPPARGLRVIRNTGTLRWRSILRGALEGDENSLAARMAEFIERTAKTYPYREAYTYTGYNSNTYAKWVLSHFP